VFDSGVGGLSVLREIHAQLPLERLLYVADSGFAPYGDRSINYVAARSNAVADYLLRQQVKAIVIACNTATAAIAAILRARVSIPVVAIEPAVKPAVARSQSGVIGVLATRQTLLSERFARLIGTHAKDVDVIGEACPDLVNLVERGETSGPGVEAAVHARVRSLLERHADVIVLGCTHFHFLRDAVQHAAGGSTLVIEPARAVAAQLRRRLSAAGTLAETRRAAPIRVRCSGDVAQVRAIIARLWGHPLEVKALPKRYCVTPQP
jgi:glutamate racemase